MIEDGMRVRDIVGGGARVTARPDRTPEVTVVATLGPTSPGDLLWRARRHLDLR
jgi:hypothetical protein